MRARGASTVGLLLLAACSSSYSPPEKHASFLPHAGLRIEGVAAADFLRARTALLVRSALVAEATVRGSAVDVRLDAPPGATLTLSLGSAVPLASDGYYLTAAHGISDRPVVRSSDGRYVVEKADPDPLLSLVVTDGRQARHGRAFVVWVSQLGDLALLRSEAAPFAVFERVVEELPEGAVVLASGTAVLLGPPEAAAPDRYAGPSAGKILAGGLSTADYRELRHDAPLSHGDSGGPLAAPDGALVGVNTRIMGGLFERGASIALQPRWEALRALIEADRRRRGERENR